METEYPRKVNYEEYEHTFSFDLLKDFEEGRLRDINTEKIGSKMLWLFVPSGMDFSKTMYICKLK